MSSILIDKLNSGDYSAFQKVYQTSWKRHYSFAIKLLQQKSDAEDILQEFYSQLWEKREEVPRDADLDNYLFRWLQRLILNRIRAEDIREKHTEAFIAAYVEQQEDALGSIYEKETHRQIKSAVWQLPEKMREIFILNRLQHVPVKEIAMQLGLSEQTVRNQLSMAIKRIRTSIEPTALLCAIVVWTANHIK